MNVRRVAVVLGAVVSLAACQQSETQQKREAVQVQPTIAQHIAPRTKADESRFDRQPVELAPERTARAEMQGGPNDPAWMPRLRKVCDELGASENSEQGARFSQGWEAWKSKLQLDVRDLRIFSPQFKTWSLAKVDDPTKASKVKHKGPYYGFGLTVELQNKSDQVLQGDNIYVWATFKSKTGKRICFGDAGAQRSWNPFAKKGRGAWIKEKEYSEWPLRPGERKRYTVTRSACMTALFTETEVTDVNIEVYARFRPLGNDVVIAGPLATFNRPGQLLRGLPVAASAAAQKIRTKKAPIPVTALYAAGDHVLAVEDKKARWVPTAVLMGVRPKAPIATEALPAETGKFEKTWGSLTMAIDNWRVEGWQKYQGKLKQGHKLVSADVTISVDTSSVKTMLEKAVTDAQNLVTEQTAELTTKEAALTAADMTLVGVKGTEGEAEAKAAAKAAEAELKAAKKALKTAEKGLKSAQKAMGGGVSKFLKGQAKAVDCGSFRMEVGRAKVKPFKGSMGKKACKQLLGGQTVKGTVSFDLQRWDMPFAMTWKGVGKSMQSYRIASDQVGRIPKD